MVEPSATRSGRRVFIFHAELLLEISQSLTKSQLSALIVYNSNFHPQMRRQAIFFKFTAFDGNVFQYLDLVTECIKQLTIVRRHKRKHLIYESTHRYQLLSPGFR